MTKTMFRDQVRLVRPRLAGPRPRATQLHAGLPEYDPRLSAPELRWYDLLLGRVRPRPEHSSTLRPRGGAPGPENRVLPGD